MIEISDDGKGLDRDRLVAKAIEKGILAKEKAASLTEREAFGLIFAAGFSTAEQVTNVSGRGVGMDVVKSNVEKIGGVIELTSQKGRGTTIRLKIPLTLAIVPAMIVCCGPDFYAIPQVKLVELVRAETGRGNQIEYLQGKPVYRLRGSILPLVDLRQVLGETAASGESAAVNIVVLQGERQLFGLIVDEIKDTADIVVKPLSRFLKDISIYSGATVLGDGSVALILDVIAIGQRMQLLGERGAIAQEESTVAHNLTEVQEFLLFRLNASAKHAIPLNLVHRLEEFRGREIELSGGQRVVRYRNSVLPLISLDETLQYGRVAERDVVPVIVVNKGGHSYGVEVGEIIDVLSTDLRFDDSVTDRREILGNLITQDEVVVIVDVLRVLDQVAARLGQAAPKSVVPAAGQAKPKVLFAEDTAFFRKHVCAVLEKAGFEVTAEVNGQAALDRLVSGDATYDLVLSDIEMPQLNGLELAKRIRAAGQWKDLPLIALTTRFDGQDVEEGRQAGFDHYLEKMNPDALVALLISIVGKKKGAHRA